MQCPVMQAEWQRRQRQRSVWMLLGLLAMVSATTPVAATAQPVLPIHCAERPQPVELDALQTPSDSRQAVSHRYWRQVAPVDDQQAQLASRGHTGPGLPSAAIRRFCCRFVRPPLP